jgi:hypothetical protein
MTETGNNVCNGHHALLDARATMNDQDNSTPLVPCLVSQRMVRAFTPALSKGILHYILHSSHCSFLLR